MNSEERAEKYRQYLAVWDGLNSLVDQEDRIYPAKGDRPTYDEVKRFYKQTQLPLQRKLMWLASGKCVYPDFPEDEAKFQKEYNQGIINETAVTTTAEESSDSDYDEDDIPALNNNNCSELSTDNSMSPQNLGTSMPLDPEVNESEKETQSQNDDLDSVYPSQADEDYVEEDVSDSEYESFPSTQRVRKELSTTNCTHESQNLAMPLPFGSAENEIQSQSDDLDSVDPSQADEDYVEEDVSDSEFDSFPPTQEVTKEKRGLRIAKSSSKKRKAVDFIVDDGYRNDYDEDYIGNDDGSCDSDAPSKKKRKCHTPKSASVSAKRRTPRFSSDDIPAIRRRLRSTPRHVINSDLPSTSSVFTSPRSSSSKNTVASTSSIPAGFEKIPDDRRRNCSDLSGRKFAIIYIKSGLTYFRKFKLVGNGMIDDRSCMPYHCIQCEKLKKITLAKLQIRNNACYAEKNHHPRCELKEWDLDED